ncbi:MAG: zf-HC2 domain-containing protein [Candidatus Marinimicrobia bacterium]|jgi:hypothetical protein|nr:zf-HC2 domain-containing protein [Candidatus Neomarinimicrobiota bacterium]MBT3633585.1 zf-HC2 domain-containing protein [Candidatus Neomarinimicrobiota bacterium]MBT3682462.1 zf-HC2 domain-containing protein [Candidatus Neomarinimicrobiota bacterium]MBT3759226.1 zf-HC2 domain-containing protein [Candidatus Neomarinimicrobiota bacterium]MBT3895501.1 zf-HC2 domain-containing protein [Candidatus Neomarinimicrobiota bacterium]
MKCTDIKDKLTDLLFEELTDEDRQLTEKHIQSCDSCKAEYDELRITKNILVEMEEIESTEDLNFPQIVPSSFSSQMNNLLIYSMKWGIAAAIIFLTLFISKPLFQYGDDGILVAFGGQEITNESLNNEDFQNVELLNRKYQMETIQLVSQMIQKNNYQTRRENLNAFQILNDDIERKRQYDLQLVNSGFQQLERGSKESVIQTGLLVKDLLNTHEIKGK